MGFVQFEELIFFSKKKIAQIIFEHNFKSNRRMNFDRAPLGLLYQIKQPMHSKVGKLHL